MNADKEYSLVVFDRIVADHGAEAVKLKESRSEFAAEYQRDVMAGRVARVEQSLLTEGEALFDRYVRPERDRRSKGKHGFAENIAASLLGNEEPMLDLAVPVGDGTDKILRFWSHSDWDNSIRVRDRQAQDAVEAADEHRAYARTVIAALVDAGAAYTGELFTEQEKAA